MLRFRRPSFPALLLLLVTVAGSSGCATLQQVMALRDVDFEIDRVADVRLAGIPVENVGSFSQLGFNEVGRIAAATADGDLPLSLDLHLAALNPAENSVDARLVRMDWTLFIEDRETLSGTFDDEVVLPPGEPRNIAIPIQMNLVNFFEGSARDLAQIALSLAGAGGEPTEISVRASPTIRTALGPITYPQPITIVRETVGQRE